MGREVERPSVSIVIPFYAGEGDPERRLGYLSECLGSVRAQTFPKWEALVVDDGSPHESSVRGATERLEDERISYVRHSTNRGLGAARNTGFEAAHADVVLPLDSDDRLRRTFLERTYGLMAQDDQIDVVFTYFQLFDGADLITRYAVQSLAHMLREQWIPGPGSLMRRNVWELVGGYAELPALLGNEDWDFWISALSKGVKAVGIEEPLYEYRFWSGSLTFRYPPQDGHVARRAIHDRHEELFHKYHCSRVFLAGGYLNSSIAALKVGRRGTALRSAVNGLLLTPLDKRLWRQLTVAVIPTRAKPYARTLYRFLSGASLRVAWLRALELIGRKHYPRVKKYWWDRRATDLYHRWGARRADFAVLTRIVQERNVSSVLDVGCGHGRLFGLWQELGVDAVGVDISKSAVSRAQAEYPTFTTMCLPLERYEPDRTFDLVVSNRTLQHVEPRLLPSILSRLCSNARLLYLNEISHNSEGRPSWYLWFHDFDRLLQERGMILADQGTIETQRWLLYANPAAAARSPTESASS